MSFPKVWSDLCAFILSVDKSPYVWGQFSLHQIQHEANAVAKKKNMVKLRETISQKMREYATWSEAQRILREGNTYL